MLLRYLAEEAPNPNEYILHHLTFLTNKAPHGLFDFGAINLDSVFFSVLLAVVFFGTFYAAARHADTGAPSKFRNFVEWMVELVDEQVQGIFHTRSRLIAPLALTIFCWVFLFNAFDVLPLDLLPGMAGAAGVGHLRIVPSTDLNVVFGLSLTVFVLIIFYSIKMKGLLGFLGEFVLHPLRVRNPIAQIPISLFNLVVELAGFIARPVSLALRLYGNIFAGEMVFILIALMTLTKGFAGLATVGGWVGTIGSLVLGVVWSGFDLFIGFLQAFIFMILTVVYLAQASEHH
ncbi:MAG TPA: F0F1 ATP synthase subunit A [Steroidobacteraceae bacterium]|nr:F0F1 ATP synthase subunit A [Steroidobacteraceae bacterium]